MSKREISVRDADSENRRKKRLKKLKYWLVIDVSVAAIIFALLLYKPGAYNPLASSESISQDEVSPYLLRLSSEINHKAPLGKPFEIEVTQEALNDIINRTDWPKESEGVLLYAPAALIHPDLIVLMGTAKFQGVEFIITVELQAKVDEQGMMNITVPRIKIGALNITPLARLTAKKMYVERLPDVDDADLSSWQAKIVASLLNEEAFEPVFDIGKGTSGTTVEVRQITIEEGKLTAYLVPRR